MSQFETQLAIGREYERKAAQWLQESRSARILPVYDYTGSEGEKAPKLRSLVASESLVVPDLLICASGSTSWVEVKYKSKASLHVNTATYETGLPLRLWLNYKHVQEVSGLPVEIIFIHRKECEIRGAMWNDLKPISRVYHGNAMSPGGMVFFPYYKIPLLASLDGVDVDDAA